MMNKLKNELMEEFKKNQNEIQEIKQEFMKKKKSGRRKRTICIIESNYREIKLKTKETEKKYIVIKGAKLQGNGLVEEVRKLIQEKISVNAIITEAHKIGKNEEKQAIVTRIDNYEKKVEIMKNKSKLRKTEIYIENDLTINGRNIQRKIMEIAKEERRTGNSRVKVIYQKLTINNDIYLWDKKEKKIRLNDPTDATSKN